MIAAYAVHVAWLTLYVSPFIPIVTAAVTKANAPGWLKVGVTAALAVIVAAVTTAIAQGTDLLVNWAFVGKVAVSFAEAMGGYLVLRTNIVRKVEQRLGDVGLDA